MSGAAPAIYEIPLSGRPQAFTVNLGGAALRLRVSWRNEGGAGWVLDIDDADGGGAFVHGLALVPGVDLLAPHRHLGLPGQMFIASDGDADAAPTFANLGGDCRLYWTPDR